MSLRPSTRRALRWALLLAALASAAPLALLLLARTEAVRTALREEVQERLERRLGAVTLGPHLQVGWRGQVELGPLDVPASGKGAPPVLHVERLTAWPRLRALAQGRLELATVHLSGVRLEAGTDGRELRALLGRLRGDPRGPGQEPPGSTRRALPRVSATGVMLAVEHGRRVELGPFSGELVARALEGGMALEGWAQLPGGGEAELRARRVTGQEDQAFIELRGASLEALLTPLGLPLEVRGGALTGQVELSGPRLHLQGQLRGLTVAHPRLAEGPVGPFHASAEGALRWDAEGERVELERLELALGPRREARALVRGHATLGAEPRFVLALDVDRLPFQAAVDALPPALRPPTEAERLDGVFSARLGLEGPWRHREAWTLTGTLDLSGLKRAARKDPPSSLQGPFTYTPRLPEGDGPSFLVGPANPDFVPLTEVPPLLRHALLLSEDISYFSHRGFDFHALTTHLFTPRERGPVRGGSTLSQQLAKNLFLTREKTYARKVREALLTLALEGSLSKDRMMEIYFNVIEWGPGLYGLGPASRHYFGKPPGELTPKEQVFLITIIPNPRRYHGYCSRGATTPVWEKRMEDLLAKLHRDGDLDDAAYGEALSQQLVFVHGGQAPQVDGELPEAGPEAPDEEG